MKVYFMCDFLFRICDGFSVLIWILPSTTNFTEITSDGMSEFLNINVTALRHNAEGIVIGEGMGGFYMIFSRSFKCC